MYKCSKCKKVFDYFEIENGVCPHCGETDIYEIGTCEDCGKTEALEDFDYGRLFNGMCADCFKKSISDSKIVDYIVWCVKLSLKNKGYSDVNACEIVDYSYSLDLDYGTDNVAIFALLTNLYRLLHLEGKCRNEKEKAICENAREWVFDDLDSFYEWYVKIENNETV